MNASRNARLLAAATVFVLAMCGVYPVQAPVSSQTMTPAPASGASSPSPTPTPTPTPKPSPCPRPLSKVTVSSGLGLRAVAADCTVQVTFPQATTVPKGATAPETVKLTMFGAAPTTVKVTYNLRVPERSDDALVIVLEDRPDVPNSIASNLTTFTVHPVGTCDASAGSCTISNAVLVKERGQQIVRWSGTMNADIGTLQLFRVARADRASANLLRISLKRGGKDLAVDRDATDPVGVVVKYDAAAGGYNPKPNADTNKIRDGISAFLRSRLGFDAMQNWTPALRASAAVGQSATDQTAKGTRAGDDLLKSGGGDSGAKDGFTVTDGDVFQFGDLSRAGARVALVGDPLQKDLAEAAAATSPFALSNVIAPDGAFKLVTRNDGGPGPGWRVLGGALFDAAVGDNPAGVADGAAALTARRKTETRTTSVTALYSVANRIQTSTDFVNGPFVTSSPGPGGVTHSIAIPSPRPVHAVNEGIQFSDDRDSGLSTFLRFTTEPSRAGSDVFAAARLSGQKTTMLDKDPQRMLTTRYLVLGGWRATGNDYVAPLGSQVDLSGTRGPFYAVSAGTFAVGPDFRRQAAFTFYQSRWSGVHGLQQYTTRLDVLADFANRVGLTGTGTLSAATLAMITRESTHIQLPLSSANLVPVRQGSVGFAWRPPNGEFTLQRGYAFLTDCQNVADTSFAPKGLPKGTLFPACTPVGRATFTGKARVTTGNLDAVVTYGVPTAVERTPLLGGAIQRGAALRYKFGCDVLQAAYTNRGGYDSLTDVAGSTYGVTLELHNLINLPFNKRVVLTLSLAGSTKIPLGVPPQSKTAFHPSPDLFHTPDANDC
jgi:hypothetical protein